MAVIATESPRFSALVKHEYEPQIGYCREVDETNSALGTVLYETVGEDENEVEVAVAVALGGGLKIVRGPVIVADAALILGDGELEDVKAQLAERGIIVETAV